MGRRRSEAAAPRSGASAATHFVGLAEALERVLDRASSSSWRGTPSQLSDELALVDSADPGSLPRTPAGLMRRIVRFQRALRAHGILIDRRDDGSLMIERRDHDRIVIGGVLLSFLAGEPEGMWTGSPSQLFEMLQPFVSDGLRPSWPKTAAGLGMRLNRLRAWLHGRGIIFERKHSGSRFVAISRRAA